jgi:hypothetical protein
VTIAVQQVVFADDNSTSGAGNLGTTQAATATITAGSAIWLPCTCDSTFGSPTSAADTRNGSYTALGATGLDANNQAYRAFYVSNAAAGSTTATVTYGAPGPGYKGVAIVEVSGTSGAVDASAVNNAQASPGAGTDAITSGTATNTVQPALIVALCMDSDISLPSAGTGFTSGGTGWAYNIGSGASARVESKRITATGGQVATFTGIAGTHHYNTMIAVFDETASATTNGSLFFGAGTTS